MIIRMGQINLLVSLRSYMVLLMVKGSVNMV